MLLDINLHSESDGDALRCPNVPISSSVSPTIALKTITLNNNTSTYVECSSIVAPQVRTEDKLQETDEDN
jgi:hypothetical protein